MLKVIWHRLTAIAIVCCGVILVWTADLEIVRFASVGNAHTCSVRQLLDLPSDLDAVFLGSSRVRRGISTKIFSENMDADPKLVFNLGRPGREIFRSESIVSYLIKTGRKPNVVVLEADTDLFQVGDQGQPFWSAREAGFLTFGEIVTAAYSGDPDNGWQRSIQGMQYKMSQTLVRHFTGVTRRVLGTDAKKAKNVCWRKNYDKETKKKNRKKAARREELSIQYGDIQTSLDERKIDELPELANVEIATIDRIREKLKSIGSHLIIVRQQGYFEPPLSPDVVKGIKEKIPEFVAPPDDVRRIISRQYMDTSHLGPNGRANYTNWLSEVILEQRQSR